VLLYLVPNQGLAWTAAQVPARFSTLDKLQLRSRTLHCVNIDRVADVAATVTDENAYSGFRAGIIVMIGRIRQGAQFVMVLGRYILVCCNVYSVNTDT
jgi:hypothetical protein